MRTPLLPTVLAFALSALCIAPRTARAVGPHASWQQLPTGNGYGFAVYNAQTRRVDVFTERPYAQRAPGETTRDLAYDAYFGVRAAGGARWLTEQPIDALEYRDQSHVVHATQTYGPLRAETYVLAPWSLEAPAVVLALRVTNRTAVTVSGAAVYALMNFHLGNGAPEPSAEREQITWDPATGSYAETGPGSATVRYVPFGGAVLHGASPSNPYFIGRDAGDLVEVNTAGPADDAVAGFQWALPALEPGAERWVGVVVTLASAQQARSYIAGRDPQTVVDSEVTAWNAWRTPPPAGLSPAELRVYRQSETVLRMAQAREEAPARGQILAALPPGIWSIAWVRDMAYAVAALARSGHTDEAGAGVDFWQDARVGDYRAEVGADYHVSVVRYYGNGGEWSDSDQNGPNVEFDGFGLAAWAARLAGRHEMDANAVTLRALVDRTGLIAPDSSIWEVHWNGHQKHFAYTSITAARGLCATGDATTARAVRDALVSQMVLPSGGLAGNLEELRAGQPARDAAVIEAINFGLLDPHGRLATATLAEFERLRTPVNRGFFRNDDGGGYDSQEWVFVDLRISTALRRMGRTAEADELLAWITAQAEANFGLHAELFHRETADYVGAVPMVGFGAGAYMLALLDRVQPEASDPACFPPEAGAGTEGGESARGCSAAPGSGRRTWGAWVLALVAVIAWGRRRRGAARSRGFTAVRAELPRHECHGNAGHRGIAHSKPAQGGLSRAFAAFGLVRGHRDNLLPGTAGAREAGFECAMPQSVCVAVAFMPRQPRARRGEAALHPRLLSLACSLSLALAACGPGGRPALPNDGGAVDGAVRADAPPSVQGLPVRDCSARFVFPLGRQANAVSVAGEWDRFAPTAHPMTDGLGTNTYRAALGLPPGDYAYKFVADGEWQLDPTNGLSRYVNGVENSRLVVPDCTLPLLRVDRAEATATRAIELDVQYVDGTARAGIDATSLTVTVNRMPAAAESVAYDATSGRIAVRLSGLANDKYTVRINARDRAGHAAVERIVPMWVEDEPFEWTDGPMYFVFTDRFRNGDPTNDAPVPDVDARANYRGGDLAGVLAALREGYFDALGVRTLWLSPVNANTNASGRGADGRMYSGYHGYWVTDPRGVEEHFGTLADLRAVTAEAHHRGIRVIFDLVQNQLHREHPYFRDRAAQGWFNGDGSCVCGGANCDWDAHAVDCWFTSYLPDVNWTTMPAADQMIDDALFWLTEADADGFRVDAVKHMQHIASTTLRHHIHEALESGNARYYLVGETFTGGDPGGRTLIQSYVSDRELWGQFDFPLFWAINGAFAQNAGTMGDLDGAVTAGEQAFARGTMSPFLGNHDVERFLSRAAGDLTGNPQEQAWTNPPAAPDRDEPYDRLFLAFTFLLTQPGVPLIYYGDEVGMPGAADPDNRRMMRAEGELSAREQHLRDRVRIVARARGTHPGLRRGARRTLYTDGDGYVYVRGAGADAALVAINRGTTARTVHVTVPAELLPNGATLRDLLGSPGVTVAGGAVDVPLTPRGAALFVR